MHWFTINWWRYLLTKPAPDSNIFRSFLCRFYKHKDGVIWYNPSGLEPDMRCKNCNDDLG